MVTVCRAVKVAKCVKKCVNSLDKTKNGTSDGIRTLTLLAVNMFLSRNTDIARSIIIVPQKVNCILCHSILAWCWYFLAPEKGGDYIETMR